jgi:RecA-family ATPase
MQRRKPALMSTYPNALYFEMFDECAEYADKTWLVKNVIAIGEDSTWFGPPGCGKSALLLDMAFHIANRYQWWQWHEINLNPDNPTVEPRGTIYFALERANLTRNRIGAYKQRDNPIPLPIAVVSDTINLLDPHCAKQIVDTVLKFEERTGVTVGLIIIDTFSKAIAGGDEDKAQTQNLAAKTLKEVHDCIEVHIATIGHTGKNEKAGERGSNARLGHVDLAVQITGDEVRTATVVKANDQPDGKIALFQTEKVTVRRKLEDGSDREPYTTTILAPYDHLAGKKAARTAVSKSPTAKQTQDIEALKLAIAERGQDGAVHADFWKEELTKVGRIKADDKNPRATFKRIREGLSQHIIEADQLIRLTAHPGQTTSVPS